MALPTSSSENEQKEDLRGNFLRTSIFFAIGHGAATTPLVYASSALDTDVAYFGNGTLYVFMLLSGSVLALPVVGNTGLKGGMILGTALYAVYAAGFTLAALCTTASMQGVFFVTGSICGGLAAGILWTAEGGYLSQSAVTISGYESRARESVNSELATQFSFYYLLFEAIAKVLWSVLMSVGLNPKFTGSIYVVLAAGSAYALSLVIDLESPAREEKPVLSKVLGTVCLWSDMRIWLLSGTNITFGLAAAYMNGSFNASVAKQELGAQYIGYLTAFTVIVSWALTKLYGNFGQRFGNLVPISIGAASFACISLLMIMTNCCSTWRWWICIFYALQGSGRAVYEGINKALFADTFKGEDTEGAFANQVLQMALAQAICFFASAVVQGRTLELAVLVFALLTPAAYVGKISMDKTEPEAGPLLEKSA